MTHRRDIDKNTEVFKMDMKNDPQGEHIQSEINELRFEKLNQRVMLLSIFIPIFVLIILVITYLDIKKKVIITKDKGTVEFNNLSKSLESRFSNLSLTQAKLTEDFKKMSDLFDKKEASIGIKINGVEKSLKSMESSVASRKETTKSFEALKEELSQISGSLSDISSKMAPFEKRVYDQLAIMESAVKGTSDQFESFRQAIDSLTKEKIDKTALDLAIKLQRLKQEEQIKQITTQLEQQISLIEKELKRIGTLNSQSSVKPSAPQSSAVTQSQKSLVNSKPQQTMPTTPSGETGEEITEQDIQ